VVEVDLSVLRQAAVERLPAHHRCVEAAGNLTATTSFCLIEIPRYG
jgi:hypothetical protein